MGRKCWQWWFGMGEERMKERGTAGRVCGGGDGDGKERRGRGRRRRGVGSGVATAVAGSGEKRERRSADGRRLRLPALMEGEWLLVGFRRAHRWKKWGESVGNGGLGWEKRERRRGVRLEEFVVVVTAMERREEGEGGGGVVLAVVLLLPSPTVERKRDEVGRWSEIAVAGVNGGWWPV
ncbi:hypothetical protein HAX54_040522 [Datura stramonium]|uniref:Uncharacterized protein n=1 Tax=Datura stramonium TaxID=4076 RepID=A0ABS8VRB2_DATST|nr:hypothetical protein [Datura stramonium]